MINLYYAVEKELSSYDEEIEAQYTTGSKTITVYDIDTQSMDLVEVCLLECNDSSESQGVIQEWLKENRKKEEFKLIQL
jgi:hypothetical protein